MTATDALILRCAEILQQLVLPRMEGRPITDDLLVLRRLIRDAKSEMVEGPVAEMEE